MNKLTSYFNRNNVLVLLAGIFIVLGFLVLSLNKVEANNCLIGRTLSYGARGPDVACLQLSLGLNNDGVFGPMTRASVIAYQANHGIRPDGVFGSVTRAIWLMEQQQGAPIPNPNPLPYPSGCLSNSGFSSTTGQPCNSSLPITNLPAGCLPGYAYSVLTGQSCSGGGSVINLPIGCSSLAGYSSVTGLRCDRGDNTIPNPNPTIPDDLSGGAGDIDVTSTSVDVENEVREGEDDQKILGFRIEAEGSDVKLNSVRVSFENTNNVSSSRLDRYIEDVSIYLGNRRVGQADVDEFNEDDDVYSKNISLSNAIVREGSGNRQNFYVAVTANSNITNENLENDDWQVSVERNGIRFTDGNGAVLTAGGSGEIRSNPDFVSLATSGDVRVRIVKTADSPDAGNVEVSSVGTTNNVEMLEFMVRADGTDITIDSMDFDLEATGIGDVEDIISELAVYQGSEKIGDETSFNGDGVYTIDFYDDLTINEDDAETFTIKARVKRIGTSSFAQGDSLRVSAADPLFADGIEDENGDDIDNITGSASGEEQSFYSEGIEVSNFDSSSVATTTSNGIISRQTYTLSFEVTAFGNTYYMPKSVARDAGSDAGLIYAVLTSAGNVTLASSNVIASSASSISSGARTVAGYYEIPDGETETFHVTITLSNTAANMISGFYRIGLREVHYDTNQTGILNTYLLVPSQDFDTSDRQLDSI